MTETSMLTSNPLDGVRKPGSVGPPLPGVAVRIVDHEQTPVVTGSVGNVQVRGPNVFGGYWRRPDLDDETFTSDGWFRTGDVGRLDADGYLHLVGRSKDLVISGGLNVYPRDVEEVLDVLAGVRESAVFGIPDDDLGERVVAVVVADDGVALDPEALRTECRERLGRLPGAQEDRHRRCPAPQCHGQGGEGRPARDGTAVADVNDATAVGLFDKSALALSDAIGRREISCVDVVAAHLDRIDSIDGTFHAFISRRPRDEIMAEAAERDSELDRGVWRGWMHGLPHAVKDLSDVRGLPTTSGFRSPSDVPVAEHDDPFVARIRECGAVFVGKTNTPEFGLGSHTYNAIGPTTRNVVDPTLSAGGSSGGAAVAVATGMVPVADGSDFMGSLRNPPGWNGVLGLRPSPGVVLGPGRERGIARSRGRWAYRSVRR